MLTRREQLHQLAQATAFWCLGAIGTWAAIGANDWTLAALSWAAVMVVVWLR